MPTAEGKVVSRGKIRVDARRAVAKLREHMLLDLHSYALEVVRCAAAGSAAQIDVTYDADDVVITWPGPPATADLLGRLLDLVLSEGLGGEQRRWRLLALGVNAALGLEPAFVDVTAAGVQAATGCVCVRFTPEALQGRGQPTAAVEAVPRPADMPASGMRVHVRRKLSWSILKSAVVRNVPREVQTLVGAAAHLGVPLRLHGQPIAATRGGPLLRVPFQVQEARQAWLAITSPTSSGARLTFLEHGVRLASYGWSPEPALTAEPYAGAGLPVEVVVDAPELPTNASRAAIREDAPIVARTLVGASSAFEAAVEALIALVCGQGEVPAGVQLQTDHPELLEDALGAIVCVAVGADHRGEPRTELAQRLLELPLLRDGCGGPRSFASIVVGAETPLYLHRGAEPLEAELAFWMRDVVWLRGRLAERALTTLRLADAAPVVEHARVAAERRRRLFAHAAGEVKLPASEAHLSRESFRVTEGRFAGLHGEVALVAPAAGAGGVSARIFLDGRQLCTERVAPDVVGLGVEAALAWDGRLTVSFGFDGVVHDATFRAAIWYAVQIAVMQARSVATKLGSLEEGASRAARTVLRAAIGAALGAGEGLAAEGVLPAKLAHDDPLYRAKCWRTTEPGRFESLAALRSYASAKGGLCLAKPTTRGSAADGRPILALDQAERGWLSAALGAEVPLVPYDQGALSPRRAQRRAQRQQQALRAALAKARPEAEADLFAPFLPFARPGARGLIGVATETKRVRLHLGQQLSAVLAPRTYGPVAYVVDDDRILPYPGWDDMLWGPPPQHTELLERELLSTVVACLEGDRAAFDRLGSAARRSEELGPVLQSYLLHSAAALRRRIEQLESLVSIRSDATAEEVEEQDVVNLHALIASALAQGADGEDPAEEIRSTPPNEIERQRADLSDLEARLLAVPALLMLDEQGRPRPASLAEVAGAHTGPIPIVDRVLGFETLSWKPVLATDTRLGRALRRWAPTGAKTASPHDISVRRSVAERYRASRKLLAKPRLDLIDPSPIAYDYTSNGPSCHLHSAPVPELVTSASDATIAPLEEADGTPAAAVTLLPRPCQGPVEVEILFRRRALTRVTLDGLRWPIAARVNLVDESQLVAWEGISQEGLVEARSLVTEAAFGLAESIVGAAQQGEPDGLFDRTTALELVAGLVALKTESAWQEPAKRLSAMLRDKALRWPTVQGGSTSWTALFRGKGIIYCGADRFAPWVGSKRDNSELDRHVLWTPGTPQGEALRDLLGALGKTVRDVTKAIRRLQAGRSKLATEQAPTLPDPARNPLLRATLSSLRVRSCVGELELGLGPGSEIMLADLEGPARRVPADDLPVPVRAVARVDTVATERTMKRVARDIGRAAVRHLQELADRLDELPPFVRDHYRRYLCARLPSHRTEQTNVTARDRAARVFGSVAGPWWSLDDLQRAVAQDEVRQWWFTLHPPPYPSHEYGRPILRLCEQDDLGRLREALPLRNMTKTLARDLEGEERARAAPVSGLTLPPELRSRCFRTFTLTGGTLEGEVGILGRDASAHRGLRLHVGRRPLCTLDDGRGVPLCAVLNDDSLRPNRAFDGLTSRKQEDLLVAGVKAAAQARLEQWLPAPGFAAASRWIDTSRPSSDGEEAAPEVAELPLVLGRLWLTGLWPVDPKVSLCTSSRPGGAFMALRVLNKPAQLDGRLPLGGELLVVPRDDGNADVQQRLIQLATEAMLDMLGSLAAGEAGVTERELALYRWDAWLLLQPEGSPPTAAVQGGGTVAPAEGGR
jgi:hypothetical protein